MLFPLLEQIELSPNGQTTLKIGGQSWHTRGSPVRMVLMSLLEIVDFVGTADGLGAAYTWAGGSSWELGPKPKAIEQPPNRFTD